MRLFPIYVFLILLVSLLVRLTLFSGQLEPLPDDQKVTFSARLTSSPKSKGYMQTFVVRPEGYEDIIITTGNYERLYYGQLIKISGTVKRKVLEDERTINTISFPDLSVEREQGIAFFLRQKVTSNFERHLPPDEARLLLGIAFGIKEPLSKTFSEEVRSVGLLHVIAASGMNITLLAGALVAILGRLFSRKMTIYITLLSIAFYAVFAGLEPSIVRAGIMGSLALFAGLFGRQYFGAWALFLTAYAMLLYDPLLLSDVGFQLSFLATLGIIAIKPLLSASIPKAFGLISEDLTTTLSAQLATIPILLGTFGAFNVLSVVVNAFILWTVPPLMILGGLAALVSIVFEPLSSVFLYLSLPLLLIFRYVVHAFSFIPLQVEMESFSGWFMTGYYIVIIILIVLIEQKKRRKKA